MKINSLILENFRSFKDPIVIKELTDVNIFIGPNNVGKSNILEALRYIRFLTSGPDTKTYSEMVFDGKTNRNIQFTLTFSLSTDERSDFIKELLLKNSKIKADEVIKSVFLSTLTYNATLGNNGLIQEKVSVKNILTRARKVCYAKRPTINI